MRRPKRAGFITAVAVVVSMFFIACGGGSSDQNSRDNNNNSTPVSLSAIQSFSVYVGESKTFPVTTQNTDFTVSVSPASGSGCVKNGDALTCRPTAAGIYTVTLTATADTSKKSTTTVTAPELEIFGDNEYSFFADEIESETMDFNAARDWTATIADSGGNIPAWITLSTESGLAGNNSIIVTLQPNDSGFDRTAIITITTTNSQKKVAITQLYITKAGTPYGYPGVVTVSISPANANVTVGQSKSFEVITQNTDFTLSVSPAYGSDCVKNGNNVICAPATAGTYNITVTATADMSKTSVAVLTATQSVAVTIDITPKTASVIVGQPTSFDVTMQNTDFTLSAPSESGCVKSGDNVICVPTSAGIYDVTVTSTTDATKEDTVVLTVTPIPVVYKAYGFNFSPYKNGQDPNTGTVIPLSQLKERMRIIAPYTEWVRAFGSTNGIENTCQVAHEYELKCLGSAWLSADLSANERELYGLIQAGKAGHLDGAVVGSEVLLRGDLTETQLLDYIERVKAELPGINVTYGDVYGELLAHPNIIAACDFVFVNYYPYWEGVKIDYAIAEIHALHDQMLKAAGGKEVIISETGWPSGGDSIGEAIPSPENASFYFLNFVSWARANKEL